MILQPFFLLIDSSAKVYEELPIILDKVIKPMENRLILKSKSVPVGLEKAVKLKYILISFTSYARRHGYVVKTEYETSETEDFNKFLLAKAPRNVTKLKGSTVLFSAYAEGIARALEMIDDMKNGCEIVNPHILFVTNSVPLSTACQLSHSQNYDGKTLEDLILIAKMKSIFVSFVSLRLKASKLVALHEKVSPEGAHIETGKELNLNYLIRLTNVHLFNEVSRKNSESSPVRLADAEVANRVLQAESDSQRTIKRVKSQDSDTAAKRMNVLNEGTNNPSSNDPNAKANPVVTNINLKDLNALRESPIWKELNNLQRLELVCRHAEITGNAELFTKTAALIKKLQVAPQSSSRASSSSAATATATSTASSVQKKPLSKPPTPTDQTLSAQRLQQQEQLLRSQQMKAPMVATSDVLWTGKLMILVNVSGTIIKPAVSVYLTYFNNVKLAKPAKKSDYMCEFWPNPIEVSMSVPINSDIVTKNLPSSYIATVHPVPNVPNNVEYYNLYLSQLSTDRNVGVAKLVHDSFFMLIMPHGGRLMAFLINPTWANASTPST